MKRKYRVALVGVGMDGVGTAVVDDQTQADELVAGKPRALHVFGRFIQWVSDWVEYDTDVVYSL